jgi:hypothetical protein
MRPKAHNTSGVRMPFSIFGCCLPIISDFLEESQDDARRVAAIIEMIKKRFIKLEFENLNANVMNFRRKTYITVVTKQ